MTSFGLMGPGSAELLIILVILAISVFWLWMLIDCVTKEADPTQKIVWVLIIVLVGIIGAPLYFLLRKLPRKK